MWNKIALLFLVSWLMSSCFEQPEFEAQRSGLLFKLLTISEKHKRITPESFVQFNIAQKNSEGKIIQEKRMLLQVPKKPQLGGVIESLSLINENERGRFRTKTNFIEPEVKKITKWDCFNGDSLVTFELYIDKIFSPEEYEKDKENFITWVNKNEINSTVFQIQSSLINNYIQKKEWKMKETKSGLKYRKIILTQGEQVKYGSQVVIQYVGKFLNDKEFKNTFDTNNRFDFFIGQEMQVIKGLEEALLLMKEGEKMAVILPSWLAFGEYGNSTGLIPPNTPLFYQIQVLEVN